jgi:hypothetical protein
MNPMLIEIEVVRKERRVNGKYRVGVNVGEAIVGEYFEDVYVDPKDQVTSDIIVSDDNFNIAVNHQIERLVKIIISKTDWRE